MILNSDTYFFTRCVIKQRGEIKRPFAQFKKVGGDGTVKFIERDKTRLSSLLKKDVDGICIETRTKNRFCTGDVKKAIAKLKLFPMAKVGFYGENPPSSRLHRAMPGY